MDPVSAVGLASSVLTFVDFAWNLVGGAVEIYRSLDGVLDENARLDDVQDDLDSLSDLLSVQPTCKTRAERKIARIAEDCRTDSKTLQNLLKEIAGPINKRAVWRSLKTSWLSIRSRKDVAELKGRLQEYRSEVLLHVALLLSEEQSSINLGIAKLRDDCSQLKIRFRTQITDARNAILGAIYTLDKSISGSQTISETSTADISKLLRTVQDVVDDTHLQHRILRQLVSEDMNSRANQIPRAAEGTYSWTLEEGPVNRWDKRKLAWNLLLNWLRAGDKIFHVSGNPGSGKSTLMKFLSQHERTMEELKVWATTKKLIFCVFYFWNPGTMAQRNITGLYRSLLFQSLSQCPELTGEVFPVQFRTMKTFTGDAMVERIQGFDDNHIEEAFKLLLSQATPEDYRLCFFIDGLDECEGNLLDHENLAKMLQSWVVSGAVKLCVSSRPYPEFIRTFSLPEHRQIQLHKLNEPDIRAYCLNRLGNDIDAQKRGELCRRLVKDMVRLAQGVFLWVHLVTDVLLMGFRQDDPDSVFLDRLESLPSDLDKLYTKLRENIENDPIQKARSDRMLLLAANNPSRQNLTAMAFSWLEGQEGDQGGLYLNPDFPPASGLDPYSSAEIFKRLDHVTKQINGLARGFLQITTNYDVPRGRRHSFFSDEVQFCHRTARDYLLQTGDRHRAMLESFPTFESAHLYTRILLAETIHGRNLEDRYGDTRIFTPFDRSFRKEIDPDLVSKFELTVQELEVARSFSIRKGAIEILRTTKPGQISFIGYAAGCGLDRFVLREVARDTRQLDEKSVSCSVLCAAVVGKNYDLALRLLETGREMNHLCEMSHHEYGDWEETELVPAFVIALSRIFFAHTNSDGRWNWPEELLKLTRVLLASIRSQKMRMRARISGFQTADFAPVISTFDATAEPEIQVDLDIGDVFTIVEMLTRSTNGEGSEPQSLDTTGDCRVDDRGEGDIVRLKEWLNEPIIQPRDGKYVLCKEVYIISLEWSSETQSWVQVKGWARLY